MASALTSISFFVNKSLTLSMSLFKHAICNGVTRILFNNNFKIVFKKSII